MDPATSPESGPAVGTTVIQFRAPVLAGDCQEVTAELLEVGRRSRRIGFRVYVVARGAATAERPGAAGVLDPPVLATEATGTVVVPPRET